MTLNRGPSPLALGLCVLVFLLAAGCGPDSTVRVEKSLTATADAILLRTENTIRLSITLKNEDKGELVIDELLVDDIEHDGLGRKSPCKKPTTLISPNNALRLAPGASRSLSLNCPVDVASLDEGTRNPLTDRGPFSWRLDLRATIHAAGGTRLAKTTLGGSDANLSGG